MQGVLCGVSFTTIGWSMANVLSAFGVTVRYPRRGVRGAHAPASLTALVDVSVSLREGEVLGVVGASGSGKSSLVRALACLTPFASGEVFWLGKRVDNLPERHRRPLRRLVQVVFQDPGSSFNPKHAVGFALREAARVAPEVSRKSTDEAIGEALSLVGMDAEAETLNKRIGEFSGGQQQRLALARAMLVQPKVLLLDEPVAALDASLRRGFMQLLQRAVRKTGLAAVLVTHDFGILEGLVQRVMVLLGGYVVEEAPWEMLRRQARHPYTWVLQQAARGLRSEGLFLSQLPGGCPFRGQCPRALDICRSMPELRPLGLGLVACHQPQDENLVEENFVHREWEGGLRGG